MSDRVIVSLYSDERFIIRGEFKDGFLFLHCDVWKHSKSTVKAVRVAVQIIKEELIKSGYNRPFYAYTQNPKWAKLMGGEYYTKFTEGEEEYEVFTWELKP